MDTGTHPFTASQLDLREHFHLLMDSLSGLQALTHNKRAPQSEQSLYEQALDALLRHHEVERCSIYIRQQDLLVCVAARNASLPDNAQPDPARAHQFRPGEGLAGHCLLQGQQITCNNCTDDPRYLQLPQANSHGSIICTPLMSGNEVTGLLCVSDPEPDIFHPWQASILTLFTSVLGLLAGNQRLIADMEMQIRQRTSELQQALEQTEEHRARYQTLSVIDDLTGLYNRRYFFPEACAELSRAVRQQEAFSVLLIDIDHFKRINDECGHATGDQVLCDLSSELKRLIRDGDILARYGGEEFSLVLPATDARGAIQMAERFREHVNRLSWQCSSGPVKISLSIGVTSISPATASVDACHQLDALLRLADEALYDAKASGRDRVCVK